MQFCYPAHYSVVAREVLDRAFNFRWIDRAGTENWLAKSPDVFWWSYLKYKIYKQEPTTHENMIERTRDACVEI